MEEKSAQENLSPQHNLLSEVPSRRLGKIMAVIVALILLAGLGAGLYWYLGLQQQSKEADQVVQTPVEQETKAISTEAKTMLFYNTDGLAVWQNGEFKTILPTNKALFGASVSPDFKKVIVGEFDYEEDGSGSGIFGSGINTLKLISFSSYDQPKVVGEEKKTAKWDLRWSPDSIHVAYVVNDGTGLEIINTDTNKVVLSIKGEVVTPVQWLSKDRFSYVQDGTLYVGTLTNPQDKKIADTVENSLCAFESPPRLVAPLWSKDGNYVGFYRADGYYIKAIKDNKETSIAPIFIDDGPCGNEVDILPIGWGDDNNFYFADSVGKSASVFKTDKWIVGKFSNSYAHPDAVLGNISTNGQYMVFPPHDPTFPYLRITGFGESSEIVCNNSLRLTGLLAGDGEASWSQKYPGVVVLKTVVTGGAVYSILDVKNCKLLENVLINEEAQYSEPSFVEIL